MARAEKMTHVVVVVAVLVGIADYEAYRRSCGYSVHETRQHFHAVFFVTGGHDMRLPRPAAVELALYFVNVDGDTCRHAVYNASYC